MLKKNQKTKRAEFAPIVSRGLAFHATHLTLRTRLVKEKFLDTPTFSFVVSRKIARTATKRNLLKRRGYAILNKQIKNIKQGYKSVFFFKKDSLTISFRELEQEILFLLKKSRLLNV